MGRKPIDDEQIETLKAVYAETGKYDVAAKAAGVSWSTAKKHIDNQDEYESIRERKRVDIIAKIADVQIKLLDAMVEPANLAKATLQEKATAFGIVTDKRQLISGEATERHEHRDTTQARDLLSRRVDELAERRRARGAPVESVGA